jgi:hypothetical protein
MANTLAGRKRSPLDGRATARASPRSNDRALCDRIESCELLHAINRIYKKEYGLSAKRYLLEISTRQDSESILRVLESAPPVITKMFRRRLHGKCHKKHWTPMIPIPAVGKKNKKKKGNGEIFVEEWDEDHKSSAGEAYQIRQQSANKDGNKPKNFQVNFPRLARNGRLLYTAVRPSEFLKYAFNGELIKERAEDGAVGTKHSVKSKEKKLRKGVPIKTPFLKLDLAHDRIVSHDGRHRAAAADEQGVKWMPVLVECTQRVVGRERECLWNREGWKREESSGSTSLKGRKRKSHYR